MTAVDRELLQQVVGIARAAGREILDSYASSDWAATTKADQSPLTAADLRAHRLIASRLAQLTPAVPLLSEEAAATPFAQRSQWQQYWLVDPLDGTREFLARNGQFTVNIALIRGHAPALGVVHVPLGDSSYLGLSGGGAWRQQGEEPAAPIRVAVRSGTPVRVGGRSPIHI